MTAPVLLLGYGNPSRGDDALAPLLLEKIAPFCDGRIELITDFQLQIEHALDLKQRDLVLFLDASVANQNAVEFVELKAIKDVSYSTHAMHPACVMQVYQDVEHNTAPPCFLLTMQAIEFELGAGLSSKAEQSLEQGFMLLKQLITQPHLSVWQSLLSITA